MLVKHNHFGRYYSHDNEYIYCHNVNKKIKISIIKGMVETSEYKINLPIFKYYHDCILRNNPNEWLRDNLNQTDYEISKYLEVEEEQ